MIPSSEWKKAYAFDVHNTLKPEFVIHAKLNLNEYGERRE